MDASTARLLTAIDRTLRYCEQADAGKRKRGEGRIWQRPATAERMPVQHGDSGRASVWRRTPLSPA